jgi:hypothetical protein
VSAEVAFDAGDHAVFVVRQVFVQQDMTRSFIPRLLPALVTLSRP